MSIDFTDALVGGGTFATYAVAEMKLTLIDGRVVKYQLPVTAQPLTELPTAESETVESILEILETLKPGESMKAEALAAAVGHDRGSGTFIRACSQLLGKGKKTALIESLGKRGYRLISAKNDD